MPAQSSERFVETKAARAAAKGHETDVLDALNIPWRTRHPHIRCPYPDHDDSDPSWRWDEQRARAFCTCAEGGHADGIFDVIGKAQRLNFEQAKIRAAELLGRTDLIRNKRPNDAAGGAASAGASQKTDAASLLNPPADNRDDGLICSYLGARLGIDPAAVPRPATPIAGLKTLGYYDPPQQNGKAGPPIRVGSYPCAVFGTLAADGRTHAHRIYLNVGGSGKAELGPGPNGKERDPKKSARLLKDQPSTAGCCVIWGDVEHAPHGIGAEGIENAEAISFVFADELASGEIVVLSAISAGGIEALTPWPAMQRITIAADRDEAKQGRGFKRGERAACNFAIRSALEGRQIETALALPGGAGASVDWLDVLLAEGPEAVRSGILAAGPLVPTSDETAQFERRAEARAEIDRVKETYPLPELIDLRLEYRSTSIGEVWIHKFAGEKKNKQTGETYQVWLPVCSPFGVAALLDIMDGTEAYGLRVLIQNMHDKPCALDFQRADLSRLGAGEIRSLLMGHGLRVANGGELTVVEVLKQVKPSASIPAAFCAGWHLPLFLTPGGENAGNQGGIELAADVRLAPHVARAGTFKGWRDAVKAAIDAENTPHWTLGAAAGFVGPVLQLCGFNTCGFDVSGPTSRGKTTTQQLAVSAWSSPRLADGGLLRSMRATENALEMLARSSTGTVLGLDEIALMDGKAVGRVIYSLAGGVGKMRMTAAITLRSPITWSTFVVLSSEQSLEQKVRGDGGQWTGGMAARIADIDVASVSARVPGPTIADVEGIFRNYGHAGPAFVRALISEGLHEYPDDLRRRVIATAKKLAGKDAGGAKNRSALPFALLDVCGELAQKLDVLPEADIRGAVKWAWASFGQSSEARALNPERQVIPNLRKYIAERWDASIKKIDETRQNTRDAVGWYDNSTIYLPRTRIAEAAGGALAEDAVAALLEQNDLLSRRHDERRRIVRYVPKIGHVNCYALKREEFGRE